MCDLISRSALLKELVFDYAYAAADIVKAAPAVDAVPVVHGRWDDSGRYEFADGSTAVRCSICGACISEKDFNDYFWYYCPICGAKMDGENNG